MNRLVLSVALILSAAIFVCSCGASDSLSSEYGNDAYYFKALKQADENNYPKAKKFLRKSIKNASPLIKRRSLELLSSLGSIDENLFSLHELYTLYPDEDSLLLYIHGLFKKGEFQLIIDLTKDIDISKCRNEISYYRCAALYKRASSSFSDEFTRWFVNRPYSKQHSKFLEDFKISPDAFPLIKFRKKVFSYDYTNSIPDIETICSKKEILTAQLVNDIGKSYLYGSNNNNSNAQFMHDLAEDKELAKDAVFNAYFYAARIYDKDMKYPDKASADYLKAMEHAVDDASYDNALWYFLNSKLKVSIQDAIQAVNTYGSTIRDPNYYDDFFDTLSLRMLSRHVWFAYYQTATTIDSIASKEVVAKYSYVTARLFQTGLLKVKGVKSGEAAKKFFEKALDSDTSIYYRILAAYRLNLSEEEVKNRFAVLRKDEDFSVNKDEELLLNGYADFGLVEHIYSEWEDHYKEIGIECTQKISQALYDYGSTDNSYYTKSLRVAAKKLNRSERNPPVELWKLAYPRAFYDCVKKHCQDFDVDEYLILGLIRAESFFDPTIKSRVGANGLTQLMEGTAGDIAKKLKIQVYDINDPDINIQFGTYYLSELIGRLDGSQILSLFAYNGGIGHVRSWQKSADLNFGMDNLPNDLFLETLPFAETRQYGRYVLGYAAVYAALYYKESPVQVAKKILE